MSILNSKLKFCNFELSNRLVMPPMASSRASDNGAVTQKLCEYYKEKSRGFALVIVEHAYVSADGRAHRAQLSIASDADVPGLRRLAETVHANGANVFAQISHAGGAAERKLTGCAPISASAVKSPFAKPDAECPRAMTNVEMEKLVSDFGAAAERARDAGFDGVELHSAHYYLLNQFYSPLTNRRADEYGGSLEGRLRLHLEIIKEIRRRTGNDFPLALRLGACDYMQGGTTLQDSVRAAQLLEEAGLDLLDISGGLGGPFCPQAKREGYFSDLSAAIKHSVGIPVILTGGITTAEGAEALLSAGAGDLIGVGRALLKNSDWAKNAIKKLE